MNNCGQPSPLTLFREGELRRQPGELFRPFIELIRSLLHMMLKLFIQFLQRRFRPLALGDIVSHEQVPIRTNMGHTGSLYNAQRAILAADFDFPMKLAFF
jgi:hypothetical protein